MPVASGFAWTVCETLEIAQASHPQDGRPETNTAKIITNQRKTPMSIVINTPNGNIGRALANRLLDAGEAVTIISRSPDKVQDLTARGARLVQGSIDDLATLDSAFKGARALFWLTPPVSRPDYLDWGIATATAAAKTARKHGVKTVVIVSSVGAQSGPGVGPVGALQGIENAFQAQLPNVASLRAAFFMENMLHDLHGMASGAIYSAAPSDVPMPMVATRDIAVRAASFLLCDSWRGHRFVGVHGPKDLTQQQVVAELSRALGREIKYQQVPVDAARQAMLGFGMPEFAANATSEMLQGFIDGRMSAAEPRTPETTTPTTLREFIETVIKPALKGAAAT
jgi:uncharacterized protein YbjT (DUF2867 family)